MNEHNELQIRLKGSRLIRQINVGDFRLPQHFIWDIICCHRVFVLRLIPLRWLDCVAFNMIPSQMILLLMELLATYVYNTKNPLFRTWCIEFLCYKILDLWIIVLTINLTRQKRFYNFHYIKFRIDDWIPSLSFELRVDISSCSSE